MHLRRASSAVIATGLVAIGVAVGGAASAIAVGDEPPPKPVLVTEQVQDPGKYKLTKEQGAEIEAAVLSDLFVARATKKSGLKVSRAIPWYSADGQDFIGIVAEVQLSQKLVGTGEMLDWPSMRFSDAPKPEIEEFKTKMKVEEVTALTVFYRSSDKKILGVEPDERSKRTVDPSQPRRAPRGE